MDEAQIDDLKRHMEQCSESIIEVMEKEHIETLAAILYANASVSGSIKYRMKCALLLARQLRDMSDDEETKAMQSEVSTDV